MSRRAKGHTEENNKNPSIEYLKKSSFRNVLTGERIIKSQTEFNIWHKEQCEGLMKAMGTDSFKGTYGRAQKIINMTFKYLYCCNYSQEIIQQRFQYCHMPLDSFTLEWFKREFKKNDSKIEWPNNWNKKQQFTADKIGYWSTLEYDKENDPKKDPYGYYTADDKKDYYSYRFYLVNIQNYVEGNKSIYKEKYGKALSPLELEFIEWPRIQLALAAEGFLFGLEGDLPPQKKDDIRKLSLDEKYERIMKALKERGY